MGDRELIRVTLVIICAHLLKTFDTEVAEFSELGLGVELLSLLVGFHPVG